MNPKRKLEMKDKGQNHEWLNEENNDQDHEHDNEQDVGMEPKRKKPSRETKTCNECNGFYGQTSFSIKQWKGGSSDNYLPSTCKSCITKQNQSSPTEKTTCRCCNATLGKSSFSITQWRGSGGKKSVCKSCKDELKNRKTCQSCNKELPKTSFLSSQWKGPVHKTTRSCKDCCEKNTVQGARSDLKICCACKVLLGKEFFAYSKWKGSVEKVRHCKNCKGSASVKEERACHRCKNFLSKDSFSNSQWKGNQDRLRACKPCVIEEKPKSASKKKQSLDKSRAEAETENDANAADSEHQADTSSGSKTEQKSVKKEKKHNFESDPLVIKRKLIERLNIFPKNRERKSFQFDWDPAPISQEDENSMNKYIIVKGRYGRMTKQEKENLAKYIENSSTRMAVAQAISLRSALLQQKAMFRHSHLQKNAKALFNQYNAGESVLRLSQYFDYPPMNTFRTVLSMKGYGKTKIKKCLNDPKKELNSREQREYAEAEGADSVSNVHQTLARKFANKFEDIIANFLEQRGICFVRQNQMETEQKKSFGKSILTPDFLLLDEVFVNGQQITWIDAKAFYGANIHFNIKKVRQQMSRYTNHWGGGAIMYLQGFSENLIFDGCTMLTAQGLISTEELLPLEQLRAKTIG